MVQPHIIAIASLLALSSCADKLLSNDRIRDNTALALNVPASSIVISDRRYDGVENTFYTASTPRAIYHCRIDGGNAMDFGMTNPPQCSRR
jgi:hypothetical protein